jgi:hypothetical protein
MEHCVIENLPSPLFVKEGSPIRTKLLKVLREPLVHFLAIGAGLFLLSGLVGAQRGRVVLFTLSMAWLVGGLMGLQVDRMVSLSVASTVSFLMLGWTLRVRFPVGSP